jgi:hypothetical protein
MLPDYDQRVPFVKHRGVSLTGANYALLGLGVAATGLVLALGSSLPN